MVHAGKIEGGTQSYPFDHCFSCGGFLDLVDRSSWQCGSCEAHLNLAQAYLVQISDRAGFYPCAACESRIPFGADNCPFCYVEFTDGYWYDIAHKSGLLPADAPAWPGSDTDLEEEEPWMLCCSRSASECSCSLPLSEDDWEDISEQTIDQIYEPHSMCQRCAHYGGIGCAPLLQTVADALYDGTIGSVHHEVNGCDDWTDNEDDPSSSGADLPPVHIEWS